MAGAPVKTPPHVPPPPPQHHSDWDLAVSRATVEGLHLLWQLKKGDVLGNASSQSSSQKKTVWLGRTGEPFNRPVQSTLRRPSQLSVIWSSVRMLVKWIRLIDRIPVIWKLIWMQIEEHFERGRREKRESEKFISANYTAVKALKIKTMFLLNERGGPFQHTCGFFSMANCLIDMELFTLPSHFPWRHPIACDLGFW